MEYLAHVLILALIYTILASSLDLLAGRTGLLSMAHASFSALGAYSSALLTTKTGISFIPALVAAMMISALFSLFVSLPSLRLHDDYFVIVTFAFQMILFSVLNNWIKVTGGPLGIVGVPTPVILGWNINSHFEFLTLGITLATIAHFAMYRLNSAPFGRVINAIREDEVFAKALGKNTLTFKVAAFAVSASLAAMAGSLYAHYITYIDPTSFTVMESILIISMVIFGGAGSFWGPILGAVILIILPEALRFIGLTNASAANLRQILYGSLLVLMMMFRPRGLMGRYSFNR